MLQNSAAIHPDTQSVLLAPRLALASCVRAYMVRDTRRAAALNEAQRSTWFPASPACGLTWFIEGECGWVLADGQVQPFPGRVLLSGPHATPTQSRAAGALHSFMVVLMPDALHRLCGIDIAACVDRIQPLRDVLDASWQAMADAVLAAPDDASRVQIFEAFLLPRWQQAQADTGAGHSYRDWMQALAVRAIASGRGRSLRQMERRIRQWSGQSMGALRAVSRAEQSFWKVREAELDAGAVVWSVLAQEAGYADQAHLCRESRRVTGFSPEELRRRIAQEEAFWAYRIWV